MYKLMTLVITKRPVYYAVGAWVLGYHVMGKRGGAFSDGLPGLLPGEPS